jgi:chromosome segregation ATPase
MDNAVIYGLGGLVVVLLIVSFLIWQMGQKKIKVADDQLKSLSDEKNSLAGSNAVLEEKCSRIKPLEQEISEYRKKQEGLQAEITKLSSDYATETEKNQNSKIKKREQEENIDSLSKQLAEEVQKSTELEEKLTKVAQKEAACNELQANADKNKTTISDLESKVQKEHKIAEEQTTIINKLKKVFV